MRTAAFCMLQEILRVLTERMANSSAPLLVAIDGRCSAGKTTLAARLRQKLNAPVFHMDDFYLPFALRTPRRLSVSGGHMDWRRLEAEILRPAIRAEEIIYRPYDAHADAWKTAQKISPQRLYIVEGSYALLPVLRPYYGYKIFLTVNAQVQQARLRKREGAEKLRMFQTRWIPAEENYFSACLVPQIADAVFDASDE